MWHCPICNRDFKKFNQPHSCNEKTVADFLDGKTPHTKELFEYFVKEYKRIGDIAVHATKSMISISGKTNCAYITQLGKNFMDVVFPFTQAFEDNLCFVKIKKVPGSNDYNHYFRMCFKDDLNEEIKHYMKLALEKEN